LVDNLFVSNIRETNKGAKNPIYPKNRPERIPIPEKPQAKSNINQLLFFFFFKPQSFSFNFLQQRIIFPENQVKRVNYTVS